MQYQLNNKSPVKNYLVVGYWETFEENNSNLQ